MFNPVNPKSIKIGFITQGLKKLQVMISISVIHELGITRHLVNYRN